MLHQSLKGNQQKPSFQISVLRTNPSQCAAVICASGIGDALILHTLSYHLKTHFRMNVTTFSDSLSSFGRWLPQGFSFAPQPRTQKDVESLAQYDKVFLQYDNTPKAVAIRARVPRDKLHLLYGTYKPEKHGLLHANDIAFIEGKTVLDNLCLALGSSKETGFTPPSELFHRRFPKRVIIHPMNQDPTHRWRKNGFLHLSQHLKEEGYTPIFLAAEQEAAEWGAASTPTLESAASLLYESGFFIGNNSGPSHLASLLQIPSLIISKGTKHLNTWAPSWLPATAITPRFVPNLKGLRWRETKWPLFISTRRVLNSFRNITKQYNI